MSSVEEAVLAAIEEDRESLLQLCLHVCNLPDLPGYERPVAEAVVAWFREAGIRSLLQPITPHSANAVGILEGSGDGESLILNAHMDTEGVVPSEDPEVNERLRGAFREGDLLIGKGLVNDKGQLCGQMIAARALHRTGVRLGGDLIVAGVAQETGGPPPEPPPNTYGQARDEYLTSGPHMGEGFGSRWLIDRGVVANFALVGEPTGFAINTAQAGYVRVRIAVGGQLPYTPFLDRGSELWDNPNPYEKAAHLVVAFERWARDYELKETFEFEGGVMAPKAQVHELRGSGPVYTAFQDYCYVYVDVRLAPGRDPVEILRQIRAVVDSVGLKADVIAYDYARGYLAKGAEPLIRALKQAHRRVLGTEDQPPWSPLLSMWTDSNVFNEVGIPSAAYGAPLQMEDVTAEGDRAMKAEDLVSLSKIYALTAMAVCGTGGGHEH